MDAMEMINNVHQSLTVRRVFGEPVSQDGAVVIPAARISGGGGGGGQNGSGPGGSAELDRGEGAGGGFGFGAVPAGALVIRDGDAHWRPAINVNRIVLGAQIVAVAALLTLSVYFRMRERAASRTGR